MNPEELLESLKTKAAALVAARADLATKQNESDAATTALSASKEANKQAATDFDKAVADFKAAVA